MVNTATGRARAHPNIALVKYWGKRDRALNLPAAGSLSITLDQLATETEVRFDSSLSRDELELNAAADPTRLPRVSACLDRLRSLAGTQLRARVSSHNNFPTAAGLASSASGFAALVLAAAEALDLKLRPEQLSALARQGSGSAARSLFGGFVTMSAGRHEDGSDAIASPLKPASWWPLEVVIAITSRTQKSHSSTDGMEHSRKTAPYYENWVGSVEEDLADARHAIAQRDFELLARVAERSCLRMHAVMLAADPGLLYWNGATVEAMHRVRELRRQGRAVFFTVDAGPQLKAVCLPGDAASVAEALSDLPGVDETQQVGLGGDAVLLP